MPAPPYFQGRERRDACKHSSPEGGASSGRHRTEYHNAGTDQTQLLLRPPSLVHDVRHHRVLLVDGAGLGMRGMSGGTVMVVRRHDCGYCVALQRLAIRRRDLALVEAAEHLSVAHLAGDAEREAFGRRPVVRMPRNPDRRCRG